MIPPHPGPDDICMPLLRVVSSLLALGLVLTPAAARASVVPPVSFERLVQQADLVFTGDVVLVEPRWVETPTGRAIVTRVTFRVARMLKGEGRPAVTLEFLGGRVGDDALEVSGVPTFEAGQRAVVCARDGQPRVSPIVGFNQGRFRVARDPRTGREHVTTHDGWAFSSVSQLGRARAVTSAVPVAAMPLEAFEAEILRVAREVRR
jgi:hypothetical protein